jgi:hypothetical protein
VVVAAELVDGAGVSRADGWLPPPEQPAIITAPMQAPIAAPLNLTVLTRRLLASGASPTSKADTSGETPRSLLVRTYPP